MKLNKLKSFAFIVLFFILLIPVSISFAHTGGFPYLRVNGKYSPINFIHKSVTDIDRTIPDQFNFPQDTTPENSYTVNTPINFEVDKKVLALSIPAEIVNNMIFRWSWERGSKDYDFGSPVSHIYSKPGSYLINLEGSPAGQEDFSVLYTLKIDIVPHTGYKLPAADINVVKKAGEFKKDTSINFKAATTSDSSTKIDSVKWYFGEGKSSSDLEPSNTYSNFTEERKVIFLEVRDSNGITAYDIIYAQNISATDNIEFYNFDTSKGEVKIVDESSNIVKNIFSSRPAVVFTFIIIFAVSILLFYWIKQNRNK